MNVTNDILAMVMRLMADCRIWNHVEEITPLREAMSGYYDIVIDVFDNHVVPSSFRILLALVQVITQMLSIYLGKPVLFF